MKKTWMVLKIIIISVLCSELMMFLHKVTILENIEEGEPSWLAMKVGSQTAALLWGIVAYIIVSLVFVATEQYRKGNSINNALLFGGLVGGSWWLGMIELDQTWNNVIMGIVDGVMILLVIVLTSILVLDKHEKVTKQESMKSEVKNSETSTVNIVVKNYFIEVIIIASIFTLNRLLFGMFLGKYFDSAFDYILIPLYSLFMGYMWIRLEDMARSEKSFKKALQYGVVIWGIPSAIFMYFLAFLFKGMLIGMTMRNICDVIFMTLGVWIVVKIRDKHKHLS